LTRYLAQSRQLAPWPQSNAKAEKCVKPKVNLYSVNEDPQTSAVPNFIQDYEHSEEGQEIGRMNHEGHIALSTTSKADVITLCHIEDLQGLQSGLEFVIEAPSEPQTLTGISERIYDGSKDNGMMVPTTNDRNGELYFVVGGDAPSETSVTEQGPHSLYKDELLHNQMNVCVSNVDVLLNDIPCMKEIENETSRREYETASESVRQTADILSTSLAIIADHNNSKEDEDLKKLKYSDTELVIPAQKDIPERQILPCSAKQRINDDAPNISENMNTSETIWAIDKESSSAVGNAQQHIIATRPSTALPTQNQTLIPSSNVDVMVSSNLNLSAHVQNITPMKNRPLFACPEKGETPSATGLNPDQLNRPNEQFFSRKTTLNKNPDDNSIGKMNTNGDLAQLTTDNLSLTQSGIAHLPKITNLHIGNPHNQTTADLRQTDKTVGSLPKVKKKRLNTEPVGKDAPKRKRGKQARNGKDIIPNDGIKMVLKNMIASKSGPLNLSGTKVPFVEVKPKKMLSSRQALSTAPAVAATNTTSTAATVATPVVATCTSATAVVSDSNMMSANVTTLVVQSKQSEDPLAPGIPVVQPVMSAVGALPQQRENTNLAKNLGNTDTGDTSSAFLVEEMIPTVVEDIENTDIEIPLQKRKKYRRKK